MNPRFVGQCKGSLEQYKPRTLKCYKQFELKKLDIYVLLLKDQCKINLDTLMTVGNNIFQDGI